MKSRKQLEAQRRIKRERDERQRKLEEELRLASARRKKELREQEEHDAHMQRQRKIYETETRRRQMEQTADILSVCRKKLQRADQEEWQSKQFLWCMRCDGLPDPTNLAQLNSYCYRWAEESDSTEASMERLLARAPQLNQVIGDLDQLLENTHDVWPARVHLLSQMRQKLFDLMSQEIEAGIRSILCDVERHLIAEETQLNLQVGADNFSLALGADTVRNTTLTQHEFSQMAITIDLPPEVTSTADRAIIISLLWFRQGHGWQPPQIDGQRNMTTLLQPISRDDCLYEYMDHCETTSSQKDNIATLTKSTGALKKSDGDIVDMELFLLVSGIFRMELLQLPVQPRRFDQWTIAPLENGGNIQRFKFRADFVMTEGSDAEDKNDADDADNGTEERDSQFVKLIHIKIKLAPWAFWLTPPQPVRYSRDGTWTTRGVWDVRFQGEINGSWLRFGVEEPSVVALTQTRKVNIPLQGWSLYPSQLRCAMVNAIHKTATSNKESSTENRGGAGDEDWESDDSEKEDAAMGLQAHGLELEQEEADSDDDELDAHQSDSVTLTLSGAIVSLDIEIQDKFVVLRKVRTAVPVKLQDITGTPMTPSKLIKTLRDRGLEISAGDRVRAQVEELTEKNEVVEKHLYRCMAICASSLKFSFLSSRWNQQTTKDKCIFQFQTLQDDNHLNAVQLVLVTPERTIFLPSNESSPSLEQMAAQNANPEFYADLLHALMDSLPAEVKIQVTDPSPSFVDTIYYMMTATKPFSTG